MIDDEMEHYIVALDGVSGSGKSSTARKVAKELGIFYIDTGAMYRAVTYACQQKKIPFSDKNGVISEASKMTFDFNTSGHLTVNDIDMEPYIRSTEVSSMVSDYCAIPEVRSILVERQREMGNNFSAVLDGRDISTVVFPDAKFKFYLWASPEVRAQRRMKELTAKGIKSTYEEVLHNLNERDDKDSSREHSPLTKTDDAELIDTSKMTLEEQVHLIVNRVNMELVKENAR